MGTPEKSTVGEAQLDSKWGIKTQDGTFSKTMFYEH